MSVAKAIVKGILGGAGGGFTGAVNGMGTAQVGSQNTDHLDKFSKLGYDIGNQGADKLFKSTNGKGKMELRNEGNKDKKDGESGSSYNYGNVPEQLQGAGGSDYMKTYASGGSSAVPGGAEAAGAGMEAASAGEAAGLAEAAASVGGSDYNLKEIYGDAVTDKIIENFAKISAIDFTYKPEAQEQYQGDKGVDGNEHIGVIAQELEKNPVTEGTVTEDQNGNKVVDTRHLAFADTAAIAELSRRVLALEAVVKEMSEKTN